MNTNKKYYVDNDDIRLNILTVAEKCNIEYDTNAGTKGTFYAQCPFCDSKSKKMYLTVDNGKFKNMAHCNKCGVTHSSIALYGKMKNLSLEDARKELLNDGFSENARIKKIIKEGESKPCCLDTAPIDKLNSVYTDFLKLLKLSTSSYNDLKRRGLSDSYIKEKGYKSIQGSYTERCRIANKLLEMGHDLRGVSGFYKDKYNKWTFSALEGYLIPIRDLLGRIISFQIRLDKPINNLRYMYFTSAKYETGAKAICAPNVSFGKDTKVINVTEGPLKADISTFFSNETFLGVPGVNSGIDILLKYIEEINPVKVVLCYDMDMYQTKEVKEALIKLIGLLDKKDIYYELKLWDKRFKGIDDYYFALSKKESNL